MEFRERLFLVLAAIFITSLIMANIIGITKIFTFWGISVPVGILPYPITFLATDLICELYGKKRASFMVWVGFGMNLFMMAIVTIGFYATPDPDWLAAVKANSPGKENTFNFVYDYMIRGTIASMIAYLTAQLVDVHLFHFWKRLTKGKHLWLRNNASTLVSQIVDTTAVMFITFYTIMPVDQILELIFFGYMFKALVALLDTPLFYLGVRLLKDKVNTPEKDFA